MCFRTRREGEEALTLAKAQTEQLSGVWEGHAGQSPAFTLCPWRRVMTPLKADEPAHVGSGQLAACFSWSDSSEGQRSALTI